MGSKGKAMAAVFSYWNSNWQERLVPALIHRLLVRKHCDDLPDVGWNTNNFVQEFHIYTYIHSTCIGSGKTFSSSMAAKVLLIEQKQYIINNAPRK